MSATNRLAHAAARADGATYNPSAQSVLDAVNLTDGDSLHPQREITRCKQ